MRSLQIIMVMAIAFMLTGFIMAIVGRAVDFGSSGPMVAFSLFIFMLIPATGIYCKAQIKGKNE